MRVRLLTAALVVGSSGLGLVPLASAAGAPVAVAPTAEGWYQPNPTCATPLGCLTPEAVPGARTVTIYPGGTLHVGVSGGQETARTYVGLDGASVAGVSAATLLVPLDVAPTSGTLVPEKAKAQVCLTRGTVTAVEGSLSAPPEVDCARAALLTYAATPTPRLEADLGPLLPGLASATGLALLPDATSLAPGDAWRVVFSARTRTGPGSTPPAALSVVRGAATATPAAPAPAAEEPVAEAPALDVGGAAPVDLPAVVTPEVELGEAPLATVDAPAAPAAAAPVADAPALAAEPVAIPETVRVGYAYPAVWLLPLVLLVGVPVVARTLTRDLTPAPTP